MIFNCIKSDRTSFLEGYLADYYCSCFYFLGNKGRFMDVSNQVLESVTQPTTNRTASTKKRKWREIESLRDKFQLEKELRIYEDSLEYMLDEF